MHELSIAYNIVTTAEQAAHDAGVDSVNIVHLRLGALSGVVKEALFFGYDIATENTCLEGSTLQIEDVPVTIYCANCEQEQVLHNTQAFRCPICNMLTGDIRQGKELEIVSLEVNGDETTYS
ncbi:MAG: hydrogenase maturation nickel metallochaperone HypA [Chloroflexota bacterium]